MLTGVHVQQRRLRLRRRVALPQRLQRRRRAPAACALHMPQQRHHGGGRDAWHARRRRQRGWTSRRQRLGVLSREAPQRACRTQASARSAVADNAIAAPGNVMPRERPMRLQKSESTKQRCKEGGAR